METKTQKARINGRVRAAGNGYAFFIPKALITSDVIEGGKIYEIVINEVSSARASPPIFMCEVIGEARGVAFS